MVNDESRMQEVMKLILEQLVIELKKVVKALKKTMFDFSRQNIIMIGGKHEESYDDIIRIAEISFEYREFKKLVLLQEEFRKQFATNLLMTYNYFENYQLVSQYWKIF